MGIDPDPAEVAQARTLGIYSSLHVAEGDAVPEPDGSFEWVLSNSVLEHIPDVDPVLKEVGRLLQPDGKFIFTVPGPDFHELMRGPLIGGSRQRYLDRLDARVAHCRYWGRAQWKAALEPHGMRVQSTSGYFTRSEVRRWESISRMTAGVLYTMAGRRRQPIDIQRRLGMRKPGTKMPSLVARSTAALVSIGLDGDPRSTSFGCLLVIAAKSAT